MSRAPLPHPHPPLPAMDALVIRPAYPDDAATLERLAALDSRRPLDGPVIVAERDGRILAALATVDGRTIADPFSPTADLVALLTVRAADATRTVGRRDILRRVGANTRRRPALARG
ncbi:MAG TPA: hypothetical protein VNT03_22110 [Baekduia sp.]|nr:hypothetical protein [Baekduia sp.]